MTSPADIVNQAVQLVAGYDNQAPVTGSPPLFDSSTVGLAAGAVYDNVVKAVTRQIQPDFARAVAVLALTQNTPPLGFTYEYAFPDDAVQVLQVLPPTFTDKNDPRPLEWTNGNAVVPFTAATGYIDFPSNPVNGQAFAFNFSSWSFTTGTAGPNETHIGSTLTFTIAALVNNMNASSDPFIQAGVYTQTASGRLFITAAQLGPAGNALGLIADPPAVASNSHLTGGSNIEERVIWTDEQTASVLYLNQPNEDAWDALFQQTVVRMLASILQLATAGRPEASDMALKASQAFAQIADARVDG